MFGELKELNGGDDQEFSYRGIGDETEVVPVTKPVELHLSAAGIINAHAKYDDQGKLVAFVDENGKELSENCEVTAVSFSESELQNFIDLFKSVGIDVFVDDNPVDENGNVVADIYFNWSEVNDAIKGNRIQFNSSDSDKLSFADVEVEAVSFRPIRLHLTDSLEIDVHARFDNNGQLLTFVDEEGKELDGVYSNDPVVFEDDFKIIEDLFEDLKVSFSGEPSENLPGQHELSAEISFFWEDLNNAIRERRVAFEFDEISSLWAIKAKENEPVVSVKNLDIMSETFDPLVLDEAAATEETEEDELSPLELDRELPQEKVIDNIRILSAQKLLRCATGQEYTPKQAYEKAMGPDFPEKNVDSKKSISKYYNEGVMTYLYLCCLKIAKEKMIEYFIGGEDDEEKLKEFFMYVDMAASLKNNG